MTTFLRKELKKIIRGRSSSQKPSPHQDSAASGENGSQNSTSNPHPSVQKGQLGLVQLNSVDLGEPDDELSFNVDIVAIHGLGGDIHSTWTHKNGTFWLQDLLPVSMPGARVFSYGYPSDTFLSRSVAGIRDFAVYLLNAIEDKLREDARGKMEDFRPIIYICHSLGGIVFKQAMNIACDRFPAVWLRSKGVVFLGTPHRGSSIASQAEVYGNILNVAWHASGLHHFRGGVRTTLIRNLSQNSPELVAIADSFTQRASTLLIVTFYEKYNTSPVGAVIVDETSALIGVTHERRSPLWANHRDICRFGSENSENYKHVSASLQRMAEDSLHEVRVPASSVLTGRSLDQSEKTCITLLNTTDIEAYESRLDQQRTSGTLQWVLQKAEYTTWLSDDASKLLWVTGYTGCGKTVLSSYIVHCLSENIQSRTLVCRFFCNGTIEELRDPSVLLRSLIYQIVYRRRKLLRLVRKASDLQGVQLFSRFDALWDLFVDITRHEKAGPINVVIDAIDECEEQVQIMIVERISKLLKSDVPPPIKFFITSRPNSPAIHALQETFVRYNRLRLEENQGAVSEDIRLVIRQRLELFVKRGRCDATTRSRLETLLLKNADQTFLWVSLTLELLERRRLLLPADLQKIAQRLPPNLTILYDGFLNSIPPEDRDIAGKLLRIIVTSARPLNLDEIRTLLELNLGSSQEGDHLRFSLDSVQVILGPLIRVSDSRIYLVHQSLKEYLVDLGNTSSSPLASNFGVCLARESLMIARSCIRYLTSTDFGEDLSSGQMSEKGSPSISMPSPKSSPLEHLQDDTLELLPFQVHDGSLFKEQSVVEAERFALLAKRHKLYDYAALHWATHLAQSNDEANIEVLDTAAALCEPRSDFSGDWFRYYWIMTGVNERYPEVVEPLFVASFFGHVQTVRRLLDSVQLASVQLGVPLYWAARQGHVSCVETLLAQDKVKLDDKYCYANKQSPLAVASQYGHRHCLQALIDSRRFAINEKDINGRTPLSLAAGSGHTPAVATLLRQEGIDPDLPDTSGSSPLFWAVSSNSAKVTAQLLADSRVNPNRLDRKDRSALSWATEYGSLEPAKQLIKDAHINLNIRDSKGWTPLIHATQQGDEAIVRLLIGSKRCDNSGLDNDGRNAISWAAERYHYNLLYYLLKHDRAGADVEDKDGWTPLAWALRPPGYTDNIFILTSSGLVDINHRDRDGRSPFSFAAGYGYLEVVKVLSRMSGIKVDSRDSSGRTPFSYAAGNGNGEIVQYLSVAEGVEVDSRDNGGRTPLSWAASAGHLAVVHILISIPGIDVRSVDQYGRMPLWYATHYGKPDVAAALEPLI